jgi:hypothetical protein
MDFARNAVASAIQNPKNLKNPKNPKNLNVFWV